MNDTLIGFGTAVLAKKKGFNEPCQGFTDSVNRDSLLFVDDICWYVYKGYEPFKEDWMSFIDINEGFYLCPSQSLLQKWLRDKHQIHISIYPIKNYWNMDIRCCDLQKQVHITLIDCENPYSTYEEALEKGLYEALKLIK